MLHCGLAILIMCIVLSNVPNAQGDFNIQNWPLTILYLLTVSWTFSAFGVIIGVIAKSWDEIGSFSNFIFMFSNDCLSSINSSFVRPRS